MILVYLYSISKVMKNKFMKKVTIETKYSNSWTNEIVTDKYWF
jgi:hypothetical protein